MKLVLAALALVALGPASAFAQTTKFTGKIYDRGNRSTPIYNYAHETKTEGEKKTTKNVFTSPDGAEVATENVEFASGKLVSYQLVQKQIGADGKAEIKGDQIHFTFTKDGKTKTSTEKLKDNFVVGPSLIGYLQGQWEKIVKGEGVGVRLGVLDRLETVGFTLKKERETDYKGQKALVLKMKPTSFVIAALVDPLYFTFAADGSRLLELDGRVIPKRQDGSKWKDLDATTVYEYP